MQLLCRAVPLPVPQCFRRLLKDLPLLLHREAVLGTYGEGDALRDDDLVQVHLDRRTHIETHLVKDLLRLPLQLLIGADDNRGHGARGTGIDIVYAMSIQSQWPIFGLRPCINSLAFRFMPEGKSTRSHSGAVRMPLFHSPALLLETLDCPLNPLLDMLEGRLHPCSLLCCRCPPPSHLDGTYRSTPPSRTTRPVRASNTLPSAGRWTYVMSSSVIGKTRRVAPMRNPCTVGSEMA